jgi:hypothetical protein
MDTPCLCPVRAKVREPAAVYAAMHKLASIAQTALGGIQRSLDVLRTTAHDVATTSVNQPDPTALAVQTLRALEQQQALEAAAEVLERTDDALGLLLRALR